LKKQIIYITISLILLLSLLMPSTSVMAATGISTINVDGSTLTANDLVEALMGGGVAFSNVTYAGVTGSENASLGACTDDENSIGFDSGIILSSGYISGVVGPNDNDALTYQLGMSGDADLDSLIPGYSTHDATVLEFDFVPTASTLHFNYVFGSEEYNEWVNSSYNDVFGFFLNGSNVALIPGTEIPVSINNVNNGNPYGSGGSNSAYYRNNDSSDGGGSINTQMDGMTTVLTVEAAVNANETNHIKLAIADAGDYALDSWVIIQAGSFIAADLLLTPQTATNDVGTQHTVTATYKESNSPISGAAVHFMITDGPNAGMFSDPDPVTDVNGVATWSYSSDLPGTDTIKASVVGASPAVNSNTVTKTWKGTEPPKPPKTETKAGSSIWYLYSDSMTDKWGNTELYMSRTLFPDGSTNVPAGGSQMWIADEIAQSNVTFPNDNWIIRFGTDEEWGNNQAGGPNFTVDIGYWDGSTFTTMAMVSTPVWYNGYYENQFQVVPEEGQTIPKDTYMAVVVNNGDDSDHPIFTGYKYTVNGDAYYSCVATPQSDPGYPLPEIGAVILLGGGLAGLAGYMLIRRRKASHTA
jgi:hypothetical protein